MSGTILPVVRAMVQPLNPLTAGGHIVRRLLVAAVVALVVCRSDARLTAVGEQAAPAVTVREDRGVYVVEARFVVPQPGSIAFSVLTDYEQIPRFMPDVERSTVLARGNGHAVVEQEAHPHFMMFSKRVHLVLEVAEEPTVIRFRDRCGKSFSQYEGSWHIRAEDHGAAITYQLTANPSFDVPGFILKRLLRRDANQMIDRLRREIAARSGKS